ncbi:GAF domain-containing sensor histidine kinase [Mucilaginibacter sp. UR6-1]|uniref:GAF domain-containing sensor histidine kinase n=1 Tax=Mucilaginibacter sp. UR6-1 TaxID=1435643 RepID=UPI001E2D013D|nr:GAF domain-containing sensor histidine kinase [Mucilaginibacter sp. UR6-1]MCC8407636.1 GAF domain-containing sensor histidine kinase [Mucilaginibacter sp. UR6-1]
MQADMLPVPVNEMERVIELSDYDLDYSSLQDQFKDLTTLAAKIAGTDVSLVNLIDSYTSWTIARHGLPVEQLPREETVCQYTIAGADNFEVSDLTADERFKDKSYVSGAPNLKYYFGVPLRTASGNNLGALCLMDAQTKQLSPEKIEMLKIIAGEIVNRLQVYKTLQELKRNASEAIESKKRVAHDIRGPVGGIIGLARVISEQGDENSMEEVLEFINLIYKSGNSILELADEILSTDISKSAIAAVGVNEFNQLMLKDRLEKLYAPQALNKGIHLTITTNAGTEAVPFSRNKLMQIMGNIISNSIKFTPRGGGVSVSIDLQLGGSLNTLIFTVADNGIGMLPAQVASILMGEGKSTKGTVGEQGYGFGLSLVKHLIDSLNGNLDIASTPGQGSVFTVKIPQSQAG